MKITQAERKRRTDKNTFWQDFQKMRNTTTTQGRQYKNLFQMGRIKYSYKSQEGTNKYSPYAHAKKEYARKYDGLHRKHRHTKRGLRSMRL